MKQLVALVMFLGLCAYMAGCGDNKPTPAKPAASTGPAHHGAPAAHAGATKPAGEGDAMPEDEKKEEAAAEDEKKEEAAEGDKKEEEEKKPEEKKEE